MIRERLSLLRAEMAKRGIDYYVVPTADFHESEYVGDYFKARAFLTGFTGSNGTAVISASEAGLWTDGRYFLQAAEQLKGSTITLFKMGEEGVPTILEYLRDSLREGGVIGFDGRVVNDSFGCQLEKLAASKGGKLYAAEDLIGLIWKNRPALSKASVSILDDTLTGRSAKEKLAAVRKIMKEKNASVHLLTSLCDIAWLLNVRGGDIDYCPVVLSYIALTEKDCFWFLQPELLTDKLSAYLSDNGITAMPYDGIFDYVGSLSAEETVLLDTGAVNYRICSTLRGKVSVINERNPSVLMKACKNEIEIRHIRDVHEKDAVSMCKFLYWLKSNVGKIPMTEISVSDKLEAICRKQEDCFDLSFNTICGYGTHGAIIHYSATKETDAEIKPEGFLLVDSGRQYYGGTTDITRTIALGPITDEMRANFTRIARANINLASARFLYGCSGLNLDILAREPLWEIGLDYKHGTGHGIGYILSVHEGPNGIRWHSSAGRSEGTTLEEGMVTSDEPGIYLEGKYGIRTENELLCKKGEKNEYGQFMYFENLTYVPIDLDAIDPDQMSPVEKQRLNAYHAKVYETVAPHLTESEAAWLKTATRAI